MLGGFAALGYSVWWDGIPASHVGAHHERDRIWIVAYTTGERPPETGEHRCGEPAQRPSGGGAAVADPDRIPEFHTGYATETLGAGGSPRLEPERGGVGRGGAGTGPDMANPDRQGYEVLSRFAGYLGEELTAVKRDCLRSGAPGCGTPHDGGGGDRILRHRPDGQPPGIWHAEPGMGRLVNGVAARLVGPMKDMFARVLWEDQLMALGNSLVHQIPLAIGRAIVRADSA